MKLTAIVVGFGFLLFAWMFRYELSGHVGHGDPHSRPIMLDRWTGRTYVHYASDGEVRILGAWAETRKVH